MGKVIKLDDYRNDSFEELMRRASLIRETIASIRMDVNAGERLYYSDDLEELRQHLVDRALKTVLNNLNEVAEVLGNG